MTKKISGIYQIENIENGHLYIGQSCNVYSRKNDHFRELRKGKHSNGHLQNAYNKYGEEKFSFSILIICELFELTRYEQACVDILKPEYNICVKCTKSRLGTKFSEEVLKKLSQAHKGCKAWNKGKHWPARQFEWKKTQIVSEETRIKISIGGKGRPSANKGKKYSEERRKQMSEASKGRIPWNKGKTMSDACKLKLSLYNLEHNAMRGVKGIKRSEESKRKMSESRKAYFVRKKQMESENEN